MNAGVGPGMKRRGKGKRLVKVRCKVSGCSPPLTRGFEVRLLGSPGGQGLLHFIPVNPVPFAVAWSTDWPGWL